MKTMILVLMFLAGTVQAGQVSYQESSMANPSDTYFTKADRTLQINYDLDDGKYLFVGYRKVKVCPYYCGFTYDMLGVGFGKSHKVGAFTVYGQAGFYYIENSVGSVEWDENLYYYLRARFDHVANRPGDFISYEVRNSNAPAVTFGVDYPISDNFGLKLAYRYMKVPENIIAYFDPATVEPGELWHDPVNRDLSTISVGIYYNF